MMKKILYLIVLLQLTGQLHAGKLEEEKHILFSIERSRSSDKVIYELMLNKEGHINNQKPIYVYWMNEETSSALSFIQRKYGYGIHIIEQSSTTVKFIIKALPNQVFNINLNSTRPYNAHTKIDHHNVHVRSIFIQFAEGTNWSPDIAYINIFGTDQNKKQICKTIKGNE